MLDLEPRIIRAGIVYGGDKVPDWQERCVALMGEVGGVELAVARVAATANATNAVSLPAEAVKALQAADLDFILCFAGCPLPRELSGAARLGVWRYQAGDHVSYRGPYANFWEVHDGIPVSGTLLVRERAEVSVAPGALDTVLALRQGFLRTQSRSLERNMRQRQECFTHWPAQLCREIAASPAGEIRGTALRAREPERPRPSLFNRLVLKWRVLARGAREGFDSLFRHDQWNIGIIDRPIEQSLNTGFGAEVRWMPGTPRAEFRADPFGIVRDGQATILCEYFSYRDHRGYIVAVPIAAAAATPSCAAATVEIGPCPAVHLSYPYLIDRDGALGCIPESSAAAEVVLYEFERFPDRCRRVATLLSDRAVADATLFRYENRWWMAASEVADKGANAALCLWFADSITGPWLAHPDNPVKIDVRSARPAGEPFLVDGVLYRPSQDCSRTYGGRIVINRVHVLTPGEFREEPAGVLDPDPRGPYPRGLHTVSRLGNRTLIDGKRTLFVPAQLVRIMRRLLGLAPRSVA